MEGSQSCPANRWRVHSPAQLIDGGLQPNPTNKRRFTAQPSQLLGSPPSPASRRRFNNTVQIKVGGLTAQPANRRIFYNPHANR
jgi:hypothetical protein